MFFKNSKNKHVICVGDKTDHGGTVLNGSPIMRVMGKPVARTGDMVTCPKCNGTFPIVEGDPMIRSEGRLVAFEGHHTACGAMLISNAFGGMAPPPTAMTASLSGAGINSLQDGVIVADSRSDAAVAVRALEDDAQRKVNAYDASYQRDVDRIYAFYRKAIDDMERMGVRRPGKGMVNALLNNFQGDGFPPGAVIEAFGGTAYWRCYPLSEYIFKRFPQINPPLELKWEIRIAENATHYWLEAVPQASGSMVVFMDPLYDEIYLTQKRTERFARRFPPLMPDGWLRK